MLQHSPAPVQLRYMPVAPQSVLRKTRQAGSFLKALISARRRICGTLPVCQP